MESFEEKIAKIDWSKAAAEVVDTGEADLRLAEAHMRDYEADRYGRSARGLSGCCRDKPRNGNRKRTRYNSAIRKTAKATI